MTLFDYVELRVVGSSTVQNVMIRKLAHNFWAARVKEHNVALEHVLSPGIVRARCGPLRNGKAALPGRKSLKHKHVVIER